jgi:hypothetical protein
LDLKNNNSWLWILLMRNTKKLFSAIAVTDYQVLSIADYIRAKKLPEKFIIIRHDVDLDPYYQLKFARLEHEFNIRTSYYFRKIEKIFKKEVIDQVAAWGHEVGYHYEVFTKAKGDAALAMEIFKNEQAVLAKHGTPPPFVRMVALLLIMPTGTL